MMAGGFDSGWCRTICWQRIALMFTWIVTKILYSFAIHRIQADYFYALTLIHFLQSTAFRSGWKLQWIPAAHHPMIDGLDEGIVLSSHHVLVFGFPIQPRLFTYIWRSGDSISHTTCWHQWKHRCKNEICYGLSHTQMSLCNASVLHDKVGRRDHERMYKEHYPACKVQWRGNGTNKRKTTLRVDVCMYTWRILAAVVRWWKCLVQKVSVGWYWTVENYDQSENSITK